MRDEGHILFESCRRVAYIIGSSFDVVRRRGAHVSVTENPLDHRVRHTQAVQVVSEAAPRDILGGFLAASRGRM